jgi:hypothetical protein
MNERPILMSGEMVRAYLAGLKTVTRRVIRPQPEFLGNGWPLRKVQGGYVHHDCPYGVAGDRLWFREAWRAAWCWDKLRPSDLDEDAQVWYEAGGRMRDEG